MSDAAVDRAVFAFLASCVGDFTQWPQCSIVSLLGNNESGRFFGVLFKATARNPNNRTVFKVIITKDEAWRVRVIQVSNHLLRDERNADRAAVISAVNYFMELAGMREG